MRFLFFFLIPCLLIADSGTWDILGDGTWNNNANWTGAAFPDGATDVATLSAPNATDATINITTPINLLTFSTDTNPAITGAGITFENVGGFENNIRYSQSATLDIPITIGSSDSTFQIFGNNSLNFLQEVNGTGDLALSFTSTNGSMVFERAIYTGRTDTGLGTLVFLNVPSSSGFFPFTSTDANVEFRIADSQTYSGALSSGSPGTTFTYLKTDIGTLTLSGNIIAPFGNFEINEGTLNFDLPIAGQINANQMSIAAGAVLEFSTVQGADHQYAGDIIGQGEVVKSGAGTIILTGTNIDYTGNTSLNGGTLTFNLSPLTAQVTIAQGAQLIFNSGNGGVITYTGSITGAGSLLTAGDNSTVNLSSDTLDYTGNTKLGDVTTNFIKSPTASPLINFPLNGVIQFSPAINDTQTYSGSITSGIPGGGLNTPRLVKDDAGTQVLSGTTLSYFGKTVITDGTLIFVNSPSNSSEISIAAGKTLQFSPQASDIQTYAGTITGDGLLVLNGQGTQILSGTSTYGGATTISAGTLSVTGALSANSLVSVGSSGTLKGTGSVGPVTNTSGGTVAPGASIGTLNIVGDFTQGANSTLEIEIDPAGNSDLLAITGTANLDGTVHLLPETGSYAKGTTYRFLTAGTVAGTFATLIEADPASFQLIYGATFVDLFVSEGSNFLPISIGGLRGNSRRAANYYYGANFVATNSDLFNALNIMAGLPARYFETALIKVSPLIYAAIPVVNLQNDIRMSHLLRKQYRNIQNNKIESSQKKSHKRKASQKSMSSHISYLGMNPNQEKASEEICYFPTKNSLWVEPLFFAYNQESSSGSLVNVGQPAFTAYTCGIGSGWWHLYKEQWMLNIGGGYTCTNITWDRGMGNGRFDSIYLAPTFGFIGEKFTAYTLLETSVNFYNIDRNIHYSTINRTAQSRHKSYDFLAQIGSSYRFRKKGSNFIVQPEGEFNYLVVDEQGFEESGAGALSLHVKRNASVFLQPNLNIKFIREFYTDKVVIAPQVYVGWLINIPIAHNKVTSNFFVEQTARQNFFVQGYAKASNQVTLGFNVPIQNCQGFLFNIGYQANFLSQFQIHEANLKLEWNF